MTSPTSLQSGHDFAYDVFISYSHADSAWVRRELLPRLEGAGLRVCVDYRDFQIGAPSVTEMERAVTTSRKTLLVLTPAYLDSAWTEFEALMLQAEDPANRMRRLIPLRKEACDLPPRIGYLTHVDLADPEDPVFAWNQLLTALGSPLPDDSGPTTTGGGLAPAQPPTQPAESGIRVSIGDVSGSQIQIGDIAGGDIIKGGVTNTQDGPAPDTQPPTEAPVGGGDYNLAAVRDLLLAAFTAQDLRRLFLYTSNRRLRPLVREFSPNDGLAAMADKAIEFCQVRDLLPELLREVKEANPRQYARFANRL